MATLEDARVQATPNSDAGRLDALLDDAYLYIHTPGVRDSKASYLAQLTTGNLTYHTVEITDREITVHDGCVLTPFRMDATLTVAGSARDLHARCLAVWSVPGPDRLHSFQPTPLTRPNN